MADSGAEPAAGRSAVEPVAVIRRKQVGDWVAVDAVAATGRTFSLYGTASTLTDDRAVQTLAAAALALIRADADRAAALASWAADMEDYDALADAGLGETTA